MIVLFHRVVKSGVDVAVRSYLRGPSRLRQSEWIYRILSEALIDRK